MKTLCLCIFAFLFLQARSQTLEKINALKFKSIEHYEQFLEKGVIEDLQYVDGYKSFVPLESTFATEEAPPKELDTDLAEDDYNIQEDVSPVDDINDYSAYELLGKLLNAEKIVVIGNWIIRVNLEKEKAYVLNSANVKAYNDLLKENTANKNVLEFSTSDEAATVLAQLDNGTHYNELRLWCSDRNAGREKSDNRGYNGNRRRLDMKAVYQKAFVYFSLHGEGKCQKRFLRIWWRDWHGSARMYYVDLRYIVRCKPRSFDFQGDPYMQPGFGAMISNQEVAKFRAYSGSRALKNYTYVIDFSSVNHGGGRVAIANY